MSDAPLPFEADEVQVAPGLPGMRRIYGDPATGSMVLEDPVLGRLPLSSLGGVRPGPTYSIVGQGGDALDLASGFAILTDKPVPTSGPQSLLLLPGVSTRPARVLPGSRVAVSAVGAHVVQATPGSGLPTVQVNGSALSPTRVSFDGVLFGADPDVPVVSVGGDGGSTSRLVLRRCEVLDSAPPVRVAFLTSVQAYVEIVACTLAGPAVVDARSSTVVLRDAQVRGDMSVVGPSSTLTIEGSRVDGTLSAQGNVQVFGSRITAMYVMRGSVVTLQHSVVETLTLEDGATVLASTSRVGAVAGDPRGIYDPDRASGVLSFSGESDKAVEFANPRVAANYVVVLTVNDRPAGDEVPWVFGPDEKGFTIRFLSSQSLDVSWILTRRG